MLSVAITVNPCNPSPCGPQSLCRVVNSQAVCSCVPGFLGTPPNCRPECISSSECQLNRACVNQKCINPCVGTCGIKAECQVVNHNPICSCPSKFTGDPFALCTPISKSLMSIGTSSDSYYFILEYEIILTIPINPCQPSPCGPNSQCQIRDSSPSCSCLPDFKGSPPNCRPDCVSSDECSTNLACINKKCRDPCIDVCGTNAQCHVVNHSPNCICLPGYIGDPFTACNLPGMQKFLSPCTFQEYILILAIDFVQSNPCNPSPCGANALCKQHNNAGACLCLPNYIGNPYEGCRPECVINSDCPPNLACIKNKCSDPCPGTCGINAECQVVKNVPICTCLSKYNGDPFRYCTLLVEESNNLQTLTFTTIKRFLFSYFANSF